MTKGLEIEVIYFDSDLVELRVSADNGVFRGQAALYENHDIFAELAEAFAGFPRSPNDCRDRELGNFDSANGGGGARFFLSSLDRLGHGVLRVTLRADPGGDPRGEATAEFSIEVEPSALDAFASSLSGMGLRLGAKARLPGHERPFD